MKKRFCKEKICNFNVVDFDLWHLTILMWFFFYYLNSAIGVYILYVPWVIYTLYRLFYCQVPDCAGCWRARFECVRRVVLNEVGIWRWRGGGEEFVQVWGFARWVNFQGGNWNRLVVFFWWGLIRFDFWEIFVNERMENSENLKLKQFWKKLRNWIFVSWELLWAKWSRNGKMLVTSREVTLL